MMSQQQQPQTVIKSDVEHGGVVVAANNNNNHIPAKTSGKAQAAMICGIVGILIFGIILGPIAICLGSSAKQEIKESNGKLKGEGQAQTGIICGSIAVIIWLVVVILLFSA